MRYVKLIFILHFILLITNSLQAQSALYCDSLLKQGVALDKPNDIIDIVHRNKDCFGLDSIDLKIFDNGPILGAMLVQLASKGNSNITFMTLLNTFNINKRYNGYFSLRQLVVNQDKLESTIASSSTWDDNKELLIQVGISPEEIQGLYLFMIKNQNKLWNYKKLVTNYKLQTGTVNKSSKPKTDTNRAMIKSEKIKYSKFCDTSVLTVFANRTVAFSDYSYGLACATKMRKSTFIFFNAYKSINAKKLEYFISNSSNLSNYLKKNYVIVNLFVDDKTLVPGSSKTIGEINSKLEIEKFGVNFQPYEVIIDTNNKVLRSTGMPDTSEGLMDFLKR